MSRLEELRRKNKLSQLELGKIIGVNQNTISQWESGAHLPPTVKLLALSKLFKVSTDYLLGNETDTA